jgi:hypothetical protein
MTDFGLVAVSPPPILEFLSTTVDPAGTLRLPPKDAPVMHVVPLPTVIPPLADDCVWSQANGPVFSRIETSLLPLFAVARSIRPSPLMSAAATDAGFSPPLRPKFDAVRNEPTHHSLCCWW